MLCLDAAGSATGAAEPSDEVLRPSKRRKQNANTDATWYRLIQCIYDVCIRERSSTVMREDVMQYLDAHSNFLSREEIDEHHRGAFSRIGSSAHYIKQDKKHGLIELQPLGIRFCEDHFPGRLIQDEY